MAEYFHSFQDRQEELDYVNENGVSDPYISYNQDTGKVSWGFEEESDESESPVYAFGQFLHKTGAVNNTASSDVIGVCVIPSNFVPDGKARFMSLVNMSSSSTSGTTSQSSYLQWCTTYEQLNLGHQYDRVPFDSNHNGILDLKQNRPWGRIPLGRTDGSFTIFNRQDPVTRYYDANDEWSGIPSPYGVDGKLDPGYVCNTGDLRGRNCLTDMSGWKNTINLVNGTYTTPAASACSSFAPGYQNGNWYLPAMGELGFVGARISAINSKITEAINGGATGVALSLSNFYWSSSEYSTGSAWTLGTGGGDVGYGNESGSLLVRAFLAP